MTKNLTIKIRKKIQIIYLPCRFTISTVIVDCHITAQAVSGLRDQNSGAAAK